MAKIHLSTSSVILFDGDPDTLMFFKFQIEDIQKIYNWNDTQPLMFIRSNLKRPALNCYLSFSNTGK